jgi:hypothetical protein
MLEKEAHQRETSTQIAPSKPRLRRRSKIKLKIIRLYRLEAVTSETKVKFWIINISPRDRARGHPRVEWDNRTNKT